MVKRPSRSPTSSAAYTKPPCAFTVAAACRPPGRSHSDKTMTGCEWLALINAVDAGGGHSVWERVVEPESRSMRSAGMMKRFSLDATELMSMLFEEMIGRKKIDLFRGEGSLEGWLKRYVRGYVLNADPNKHCEMSLDAGAAAGDATAPSMDLPVQD